jgi:hypothetical protein
MLRIITLAATKRDGAHVMPACINTKSDRAVREHISRARAIWRSMADGHAGLEQRYIEGTLSNACEPSPISTKRGDAKPWVFGAPFYLFLSQ